MWFYNFGAPIDDECVWPRYGDAVICHVDGYDNAIRKLSTSVRDESAAQKQVFSICRITDPAHAAYQECGLFAVSEKWWGVSDHILTKFERTFVHVYQEPTYSTENLCT